VLQLKSVRRNAVQFGENPTFQKNISSPSGWKSKPSKKQVEEEIVACFCWFLDLFFGPEKGDGMFLRNIG
jgi:hypothetical protein